MTGTTEILSFVPFLSDLYIEISRRQYEGFINAENRNIKKIKIQPVY